MNGDTSSVVSGSPDLSTTATTTSPVGTYPINITLGTLAATNYDFSLVPGTLTVTAQAPTTIALTATPGSTTTYGQSVTFTATVSPTTSGGATPIGTIQFEVNGVDLGSAVTLVNGSATSVATTTIAAGEQTIEAVYSGDSNYAPNTQTSTQTVDPATLTVTANNASKVYGQANPTFTDTITGFVNGDTSSVISGTPTLSTTATTASGVGTYAIAVGVSGLSASNYIFTGVNGTLTIDPATLTVTANNLDMNHYDTVPTLTYAITGFVNGDTSSVVSGSPQLFTSATSTSSAGLYPITVGPNTISAANYDFTFVPGTLTVHPKVMDVRVNWGSESMSIMNLSRDLPFINISSIDVIFSDNVTVNQADLALTGINVPSYAFSSMSYNSTTFDANWKLPIPLDVDKLMLALDGTSSTGVSAPFAATNGTVNIPMENNLDLNFSVLPGDYNGDGVVTIQDLVQEEALIQSGTYSIWGDIIGSGTFASGDGTTDLIDIRKKLGTKLP